MTELPPAPNPGRSYLWKRQHCCTLRGWSLWRLDLTQIRPEHGGPRLTTTASSIYSILFAGSRTIRQSCEYETISIIAERSPSTSGRKAQRHIWTTRASGNSRRSPNDLNIEVQTMYRIVQLYTIIYTDGFAPVPYPMLSLTTRCWLPALPASPSRPWSQQQASLSAP